MVTMELTLEQILESVQQLEDADRQVLLKELVNQPSAEELRTAPERLRKKHRLPAKHARRLSQLLNLAKERELTTVERRELTQLVTESNRRTLEMARELVRGQGPSVSVGFPALRHQDAQERGHDDRRHRRIHRC